MQTRVPRSVIERLKSVPIAYRSALGARRLIGTIRPPRSVPGVPGRVHPNDTMIQGHDGDAGWLYNTTGSATMAQLMGLADTQLGDSTSARWLELGCGYGRLIRQLVLRVPPAQVVGADIEAQGVKFCKSEFGIGGVVCDRHPDELTLPESDVLYAMSVISHLDEGMTDGVLRLVLRTLAPGGIAMVSTHGRSTLDHLEGYGPSWPPMREGIAADLDAHGWAYRSYSALGQDYGMGWHDPEHLSARIRDLGEGRVQDVEVLPRGIEDHQDLYIIRLTR
jgi:SAM-dependent methyltransferase